LFVPSGDLTHPLNKAHLIMSQRTAFITGITGQDGSYLAELLLAQGYEVHGMVRRLSADNWERLTHFQDQLHLHSGDLLDSTSLANVLRDARPHEIYNLAAQSFVPASWQQPILTGEITGLGAHQRDHRVRPDIRAPGRRHGPAAPHRQSRRAPVARAR
jgi:GDPmannose 4,6-dehydratase